MPKISSFMGGCKIAKFVKVSPSKVPAIRYHTMKMTDQDVNALKGLQHHSYYYEMVETGKKP